MNFHIELMQKNPENSTRFSWKLEINNVDGEMKWGAQQHDIYLWEIVT